jgi:mono/diheme cytochrome c family protein
MFATNLKIAIVVVLTLAAYTLLANMIPQIESEVPEEFNLSGEITAERLVAAGERIYNGAGGCTVCHGLGTRAPNLLRSEGNLGAIGARCDRRESGLDCKEYLFRSLTEPAGYVVEGYNPIMPDVRRILSEDQVWTLVAFLESLGGEVTVTADDLTRWDAGEQEEAATGTSGVSLSSTSDPLELMTELGCFACHQLGDLGNAIGPPLTDVGARREAEYIRESILRPRADISSGYETFAGMMPADFGDRVTAAQLEALVEFLAAQR